MASCLALRPELLLLLLTLLGFQDSLVTAAGFIGDEADALVRTKVTQRDFMSQAR